MYFFLIITIYYWLKNNTAVSVYNSANIKRSEEYKQLMNKSLMGNKNVLNFKHFEETKLKMNIIHKNKVFSEEIYIKLNNVLYGNKETIIKFIFIM